MNKELKMTGLEIAVIGMSGRFPGAADIKEFWDNLKNGVESITFFTDEELEKSGISPDTYNDPNYVRGRGSLENAAYFDSYFFDYTRREAELMDPQMRIFHEAAWKALEDSGYNPEFYNSLIGLYAGASAAFSWEAAVLLSGKGDILGSYASSHLTNKDLMCLRVAYKLNLKGPVFDVYTTCSTSLVAVHLASQGLLSGECDIALAGGVCVTIPENRGYFYQDGMINAPDGHCRAFDVRARGTVAGSGVGVVVLKRLEEAAADNDFIYAVIKGSSINNDGSRKVGFTAPGLNGQISVLRAAQQMAAVEAESITYIETHGTGTAMGDPIEFKALTRAFDTEKKHFCGLGSVKSNIGHLDTAAGIAGFIKTVLALKHRMIPPSLHFYSPNPSLGIENSPFYVNSGLKEWKNDTGPLRAGVSSLGIGGTNVHVILEEWQGIENREPGSGKPGFELLVLSAKNKSALDRMSQNLAGYLRENPGINLADTAYTLQVGREPFPYRRTIGCTSVEEAVKDLETTGDNVPGISFIKDERPVVFMFPGQGAQYVNMGADLYRTEPLFRETMDRCFEILGPITGCDFKEVIYPNGTPDETHSEKVNRTEITQPAIFAFEYALAKLLISWGITPDTMIGHSIGEYTAACLSGVFSLEDALLLVARRGELMGRMPAGDMLGVSLPPEELVPLLGEGVSLAAVNSPVSCVISGSPGTVETAAGVLKQKGYDTRPLHTSHAFHSAMMDPILDAFREQVNRVKLTKPNIPYASNLSGKLITVEEAVNPDYWVNHLRQTVRFHDGLNELQEKGNPVFVEVGPGRTLSTFVKQNKQGNDQNVGWVTNIVRHPKENVPDHHFLMQKVGYLWLGGVTVDWSALHAGKERRHRIPLPSYSFDPLYYMLDMSMLFGNKGTSVEETAPREPEQSPPEPDRDAPADQRQGLSTPYRAPGNEIEEVIAGTWQKLFGVDNPGVLDDFFELGGDSLQAMNVIANIQSNLGVKVPLDFFFANATIEGLGRYVADHAGIETHTVIEPVEKREYYQLSPAQRRLLYLHKITPESTNYNLYFINTLDIDIDKEILTGLFRELLKRHESLRTSFHMVRGEPVQKIHHDVDFDIDYHEVEETGEEAVKTALDRIARGFIRPFDLTAAPLLRTALIKINDGVRSRYVIIVDTHHIISDGTTLDIISNDLVAMSRQEALPGLRIQYKDYAHWYNDEAGSEWMKRQEAYWLKQFEAKPPLLDLPTDFERPEKINYRGRIFTFEIPVENVTRLRETVREENATLFMGLLSIFYIFLLKLTGLEDIVLLTILQGRNRVGLEHIAGMFANTLFLRNYPKKEITFVEFLREVKTRTLEAFENQDYHTDELIDKIPVNRELGRNPVSDVAFMLLTSDTPTADEEAAETGSSGRGYNLEVNELLFDFGLVIVEEGNRLTFRFGYFSSLFKPETIGRFSGYFNDVFAAAAANKTIKLKNIKINYDLLEANSTVTGIDFEL
jgi:phthiocerol/phenolphthiocerol synthesis type-I polyketide synthase E